MRNCFTVFPYVRLRTAIHGRWRQDSKVQPESDKVGRVHKIGPMSEFDCIKRIVHKDKYDVIFLQTKKQKERRNRVSGSSHNRCCETRRWARERNQPATWSTVHPGKLMVAQFINKLYMLYVAQTSLPCSQEYTTSPYLETGESTRPHTELMWGYVPPKRWCPSTKLHGVITQKIMWIFTAVRTSNLIHNLWPSLKLRDQVSHPYKTTGKTTDFIAYFTFQIVATTYHSEPEGAMSPWTASPISANSFCCYLTTLFELQRLCNVEWDRNTITNGQ
jgi:hypothetical protein